MTTNKAIYVGREPEQVDLDLEQLQAACAWYVALLGLGAWSITLSVVRGVDIEDAEGDVDWTLANRSARIRIRQAGDDATGARKRDMEKTLVHELVHLVLAATDDYMGSLPHVQNQLLIEQPVDTLACALVDLRRATRSWVG